MGIEILRSLPAGEWAEFVAKHPHGNVFHTPEMFEVFRRTKGFAPRSGRRGKTAEFWPCFRWPSFG